MEYFRLYIPAALIVLTSISCNDGKKASRFPEELANKKLSEINVETIEDSVSYALGITWANNMRGFGMNTITNAFYIGAYDCIHHRDTLMTFEETDTYLQDRYQKLQYDVTKTRGTDDILLKDISLKTPFDTFSYALGYAWTYRAYAHGIDDVTPALLKGLMKQLKGDSTIFSYSDSEKYLYYYIENKRSMVYADTKAKNEKWFNDNAGNERVIEHPSGIQYKIIKSGNGKKSTPGSVLECNFTTRLIDGTIIESSEKNGNPLRFYPSGVIRGWAEAVLSMREGDIWEVYIPYKLAYGSGGIKNKVPPYSTIILYIELLSVENNPM
ncbi:MAG: FKBP-type peptidyl-prolyl cis-trans isomerase [Bacteroidales bacterium]|nr:FKBP-type peptidyl-prolyl cis-trans isomerase [Bacteroidales bacterium]